MPIKVLVFSTSPYFKLQSDGSSASFGSFGSSPAVIEPASELSLCFSLVVEMYLDRVKHNTSLSDLHLIEFQELETKQSQQILVQVVNAWMPEIGLIS